MEELRRCFAELDLRVEEFRPRKPDIPLDQLEIQVGYLQDIFNRLSNDLLDDPHKFWQELLKKVLQRLSSISRWKTWLRSMGKTSSGRNSGTLDFPQWRTSCGQHGMDCNFACPVSPTRARFSSRAEPHLKRE
jgi:hypothetical protein